MCDLQTQKTANCDFEYIRVHKAGVRRQVNRVATYVSCMAWQSSGEFTPTGLSNHKTD